VSTTSHSGRMPRVTASTGSNDRARSSHATMSPAVCASAASRSARVVLPDEWSPCSATLAVRGNPPGPRIASRAANPVGTMRPSRSSAGVIRSACSGASRGSGSAMGALASAPSVANPSSPPVRGAAAPQRACSVARAAVTSGDRPIGRPMVERLFYLVNAARHSPDHASAPDRRASNGRHGVGRSIGAMVQTDRPILVVDDDAKIVRLVRTYLEREGHRVVTAADGPGALAAIEDHEPSLVVLDLMLPGLDGRAVIRAVRREPDGDVPILVLSARGSTVDRIAGLEDGADDYLPKPFSPAELVVRVRRILERTERGRATPGPTAPAVDADTRLIRHADLVLDPARHEVLRGDEVLPLTRVEFRLLQVLLEAGGRVLTRDQLLDQVYGRDDASILDRTIDVHVGRLREKLGDDAEQPRYVATVRGVGYRAARDPAAGTR
jgi:two-component system, OmpR family, alkaline phosphatase synthesis response regulator PhoP